MIKTTLSYIPGWEITEVLSIIVEYDKSFHPGRNIYTLHECLDNAFKRLEDKAEDLGANAIMGVGICYSGTNQIPIVYGTAVKINCMNDSVYEYNDT